MKKIGFSIDQLGYVGLEVTDLIAWRRFAESFLGMQVDDAGGGVMKLRMDERVQRVSLKLGARDVLDCLGLEVGSLATLGELGNKQQGECVQGSTEQCAERGVAAMVCIRDPDGNRLELYHGPHRAATNFVANSGVGGFRTGALGFGHVVLQTPRFEEMREFYLKLGMRISDYMEEPFEACFLHTNARHHSLALLKSGEAKIHHLMVEYLHLDDVGRMYDRALAEPDQIVSTLGRHSNDHMLSFYSRTPSGFMIETGWAGRLIDVEQWTMERLSTPSFWGHDRKWLSKDARQVIREQMDSLARAGVRAPVEVVNSPGFKIWEAQ